MADEVTYESDIVLQLRSAAQWTMLNCQRHMLQCAADEIERLRYKPRVQDDNERRFVTLTMPAHMAGVDEEIASLRLTDAEREAVEAAARIIDAYEEEMDGFPSGASATLRGLLERNRGAKDINPDN